MFPIWLLIALTAMVVVAQGIALIMLGHFIRVAGRQTLSASATFRAHLESIESQSRISSERFRVIQASLDSLLDLTRAKSPFYAPPMSNPLLMPEVRVPSNSVAVPNSVPEPKGTPKATSWREIARQAKENEA